MIDTALILAAGRGRRMDGYDGDRPKAFIELGGVLLIERSIGQLKSRGISDIVIVTGHRAEMFDALARGEHGVSCVYNPSFADSGSLESLRLGLERVRGPFLLLESDIVYENRALDRLMAAPQSDAMLVSGPTGAGDEVYVGTKRHHGENLLQLLSKDLTLFAEAPFGELVGISKFGTEAGAMLADAADDIGRRATEAHYEDGLVQVAGRFPISCLRVDDLVWAEIDDEAMFRRTRDTVFPRILEADLQGAG